MPWDFYARLSTTPSIKVVRLVRSAWLTWIGQFRLCNFDRHWGSPAMEDTPATPPGMRFHVLGTISVPRQEAYSCRLDTSWKPKRICRKGLNKQLRSAGSISVPNRHGHGFGD